jgi:hypothetical protein
MHSLAVLLPIWIIGAPLALAILDLMRTPKPSSDTSYRPAVPPRTASTL